MLSSIALIAARSMTLRVLCCMFSSRKSLAPAGGGFSLTESFRNTASAFSCRDSSPVQCFFKSPAPGHSIRMRLCRIPPTASANSSGCRILVKSCP